MEESENLVAKLRAEKERLERENKNLRREIRTMARTIAKLETNLEENRVSMQNQDARLDALEKKLEQALQGGSIKKEEPAPTQTYADLEAFVDSFELPPDMDSSLNAFDFGQNFDEVFANWCELQAVGDGGSVDLLSGLKTDGDTDLLNQQPPMIVSCA